MAAEEQDYWYWEEAADRAVQWWNENIVFSIEKWAGQPFVLEPWQEHDIVRPLMGWRRRDDGTRRYKHLWLEMARKNGKTEFAAGLCHLIMIMEKTWGGQGYCMAENEGQARIVFERMYDMTKLSAGLNDQCEPLSGSIYYNKIHSAFMVLSGRSRGKHGKMPRLIYGDEPHEWTYDNAKTLKTLRQGMAASSDRLVIMTTTAGDPMGPGWDMHNQALMVRDGLIDDPEMLVVIYACDPDDDWRDESNWIKANPNLGKTVRLEFLRKEAEKAQFSETDIVDFKRYHLGIWTGEAARWLSVKAWRECTAHPDDRQYWREIEEAMRGRPCFGGLDLASTEDTTALVWLFPPAVRKDNGDWDILEAEQDEGGNWYIPDASGDDVSARWHVVCRIWVPKEGIRKREEKGMVPYARWASQGALLTTPGNITDYNAIRKQLLGDPDKGVEGDLQRFNVINLSVDRHNSSQFVVDLLGEGVPIDWYPQSFAGMSPPARQLERRVNGRLIEHGSHPVLAWQASNAVIRRNEDDQIRPTKGRSIDKIDAVVALVMAMGRAEALPEDDGKVNLPDDYDVVGF